MCVLTAFCYQDNRHRPMSSLPYPAHPGSEFPTPDLVALHGGGASQAPPYPPPPGQQQPYPPGQQQQYPPPPYPPSQSGPYSTFPTGQQLPYPPGPQGGQPFPGGFARYSCVEKRRRQVNAFNGNRDIHFAVQRAQQNQSDERKL